MKAILFRTLCALALILSIHAPLFAADRESGWNAAAPANIVCTTGMIADIVRRVAGDRAVVTSLMGEGVDPHLYKPTRSDMGQLMRSDLAFSNGLLLEGKLSDTLNRLSVSGRKIYPVTELLDDSYLLQPSEFKGLHDPHVWMDPVAWKMTVEVVRDKLIEHDPDGASVFQANAVTTLASLDALHEYASRVLVDVPEDQRVLVTAHDAFNYFGRRYGFEVVGIQGLSTQSEAGVKDVERIVNMLVSRKIRAVFIETTIAARNVEALVAGARAQGHTVVIGGRLFSDAMGAPGTYEGTYVGMIDHNVTTIARALGGDAPRRGMSGHLTVAAKEGE